LLEQKCCTTLLLEMLLDEWLKAAIANPEPHVTRAPAPPTPLGFRQDWRANLSREWMVALTKTGFVAKLKNAEELKGKREWCSIDAGKDVTYRSR
jgi:hypothetical protein